MLCMYECYVFMLCILVCCVRARVMNVWYVCIYVCYVCMLRVRFMCECFNECDVCGCVVHVFVYDMRVRSLCMSLCYVCMYVLYVMLCTRVPMYVMYVRYLRMYVKCICY